MRKGKKGIALVLAVVMLLTMGIFVPAGEKVYAAENPKVVDANNKQKKFNTNGIQEILDTSNKPERLDESNKLETLNISNKPEVLDEKSKQETVNADGVPEVINIEEIPEIASAGDTSGEGHLKVENLEWICNNPDKENLGVGDVIQLVVTIRNNRTETMTIDPSLSKVFWIWEDYVAEDEYEHGFSEYGGEEKIAINPGECVELKFMHEITGYFDCRGRSRFQSIHIETSEGYEIEYWNQINITGESYFKAYQPGVWEEVDRFDYDGRCDYIVPEIKIKIDAPHILSMTNVGMDMEECTLTYQIKLDDAGYEPPFYFNVYLQDVNNEENILGFGGTLSDDGESGTYLGTLWKFWGESKIKKGQYRVKEVYVGDNNNKHRYYDNNGKELEDIAGNKVQVEDVVFEQSEKEYLLLEDIELNPGNLNKDNMAAGEEYQVILTVRNNTDETMTVNPELCYVEWVYKDYKYDWPDNYWTYTTYGDGEPIVVEPGKTGKITIEDAISPYSVPGKRELDWIGIETTEGYVIAYENRKLWDETDLFGHVKKEDGNWQERIAHRFEYNRELDLNVSDAPTPDMDAPVIRSMTPDKDISEGTVTYQVAMDDYGYAPPDWIDVYYQDVNDEENVLNFWGYLSYSEEFGTYTCTFDFADEEVSAGRYKITDVGIYDQGHNHRWYWIQDGKLKDNEENILEVPDLIIGNPTYSLGDINGDGKINMSDVMLCLNHYAEKDILKGGQFAAADIDKNGIIDMSDVMRLLNYVVEKTPTL